MKEIKPYQSTQEASSDLDNGGRFFDWNSKAEDGVITQAELAKTAGLFVGKQKTMLFFEMAISQLDAADQQQIIHSLDDNLKASYAKYQAQRLLPSEAHNNGNCGSNAIITGIPKKIDSKSDFSGFIMIPVIAGSVTTFMMIPIIDEYDVYELRDEASSETVLIAYAKGSLKLPEQKIQVAGLFKELRSEKNQNHATNMYLEALYYTTMG